MQVTPHDRRVSRRRIDGWMAQAMARAIEVAGGDTATVRVEGRQGGARPATAHPYLYNAWAIALGLIGVVALALFFRLYRLDTLLHWAWGDEMTYGLEGQRVTRGEYKGLFAYTWDQAPATYAYLISIAQQLFGPTLHTDRMISALFGTLTVPLLALCARALGLSWIGSLLAAGLLAVSHWHAHFSRIVVSTVPSAFALLLGLYCLIIAFRIRRWWPAPLAGVACGFAPYMFISNRIIVVILIAWLGYLAVFHRVWLRHSWPKIALFAATFTLVLLPLAVFWMHNIAWFVGPERRVGLIYHIDEWSSQHRGESTSGWNSILHQLLLAAGMFAVYGGPYIPWGGAYTPAMDPVTGWLLVPAIVYALYRWRRPLVALVLIWFASIWFFGVVLTIDAPQMEHAVGLIAATFLLIALLYDDLGKLVSRRLRQTHRPVPYRYAVRLSLAGLLVLVSGALNYNVFSTFGVVSWRAAMGLPGRSTTPRRTSRGTTRRAARQSMRNLTQTNSSAFSPPTRASFPARVGVPKSPACTSSCQTRLHRRTPSPPIYRGHRWKRWPMPMAILLLPRSSRLRGSRTGLSAHPDLASA